MFFYKRMRNIIPARKEDPCGLVSAERRSISPESSPPVPISKKLKKHIYFFTQHYWSEMKDLYGLGTYLYIYVCVCMRIHVCYQGTKDTEPSI